MELKLETRTACRTANLFELNLYGIEIGDTNGMQDGQSTFELNLYGIEIQESERHADGRICLN